MSSDMDRHRTEGVRTRTCIIHAPAEGVQQGKHPSIGSSQENKGGPCTTRTADCGGPSPRCPAMGRVAGGVSTPQCGPVSSGHLAEEEEEEAVIAPNPLFLAVVSTERGVGRGLCALDATPGHRLLGLSLQLLEGTVRCGRTRGGG